MNYSFEELRNGKIQEIPVTSGVYWVIMPDSFVMEYMKETDGPVYGKRGNKMAYDLAKLQKKGEHYKKPEHGGNILYIGKATNLRNRLKQYYEFGYNEERHYVHEGGRAIWQLRNNKKLQVAYKECSEAEKEETELIDKYMLEYGALPFGNMRRGNKKYKLF